MAHSDVRREPSNVEVTNAVTLVEPISVENTPETPLHVLAPTSIASNAPVRTVVTTAAVVELLAINTSRKQFLVQNADILPIHLVLGPGDPTVSVHHVTLKACTNANDGTGGSFISDLWKGQVRAIAQQVLLVTSGAVVVTEFT